PPLYLFFSQGHRARRALPSFPTRRSSDLSISESSRPCIGRWPPNWSFVSLQEHPPEGACAGLIFLCCASMITCPHMGIIRHFRRDRKSTRLNSSHGSISYAVFCLKKKKEL